MLHSSQTQDHALQGMILTSHLQTAVASHCCEALYPSADVRLCHLLRSHSANALGLQAVAPPYASLMCFAPAAAVSAKYITCVRTLDRNRAMLPHQP